MAPARPLLTLPARAGMRRLGGEPIRSYRRHPPGGVADELRRRIDRQNQAQRYDAEAESEGEIAPTGLKGNGGRHRAGDARYVAANDQDRADFSSRSAQTGQHRRQQAEPPEPK